MLKRMGILHASVMPVSSRPINSHAHEDPSLTVVLCAGAEALGAKVTGVECIGLTGPGGPQVDSHLAELTVKETMDFSARVQGPGTKRGASPPPA